MIAIVILGSLLGSFAYGGKVTIQVENKCANKVWPAVFSQDFIPLNGGFSLESNETKIFPVPGNWTGTVWVRTGCDKNMNCETGDCGNHLGCNGLSGDTPFTKAEFNFDFMHFDHYYVSLLDGYNVNLTISPANTTYKGACSVAGACQRDLRTNCPHPLVKSIDGRTVACKTACQVYDSIDYCCRSVFDNPSGCNAKHWTIDYPGTFKNACHRTLTYKYDMADSIFACSTETAANRKFIVTVC